MCQRVPYDAYVHTVNSLGIKVRSSSDPLAYFSDSFISGKNVVISQQKQTFFPEMKLSEKYASEP